MKAFKGFVKAFKAFKIFFEAPQKSAKIEIFSLRPGSGREGLKDSGIKFLFRLTYQDKCTLKFP